MNTDNFGKRHGLTEGEVRVLNLIAQAFSAKEVAAKLGLSETTVKTHLQHIYSKTGTNKRVALVCLLLAAS